MKLSAIVVYLSGAFFVLYGLAFTFAPYEMAHLTTGLALNTVSAAVDLRATYGGMTLAVGVIIFYLYQRISVIASLSAVLLALAFMAATRGIGFMLDGESNALMYLYFAAELLGVLLAYLAIRSELNS